MKLCEEEQPPEFIVTSEPLHRTACWLQHAQSPKVAGLFQQHAPAASE